VGRRLWLVVGGGGAPPPPPPPPEANVNWFSVASPGPAGNFFLLRKSVSAGQCGGHTTGGRLDDGADMRRAG
jgi:hypothetical protein